MPSRNKLPTTTQSYVLPKTGSYKELILRETPIPQINSHDVLVKVHAVSLQHRDLLVTNGKYGVESPPNLIPCSNMAGEIIALGSSLSENKKWNVSHRVCANFNPDHLYGDVTPEIMNSKSAFDAMAQGVLTQFKVVPAHSLVRIPDHLSYEEASTLPCAALTAYNAFHGPVPIKAGDTLLVLGTTGVSIFALQLAVAAGATVIATSSSDDKLKIAAKLGAKYTINYKTSPEWHKDILEVVRLFRFHPVPAIRDVQS
ncbi:chaperonin 10-like protein [Panaeolus papilionaceus]|nr:chaperonin 10-like protein [Panaeolus papilionaceus]